MMTTAPISHAQIAPGPAICAARHAPNSQPEPMMEPRPVSIRANGPTSRRIWLAWDMEAPAEGVRCAKRGRWLQNSLLHVTPQRSYGVLKGRSPAVAFVPPPLAGEARSGWSLCSAIRNEDQSHPFAGCAEGGVRCDPCLGGAALETIGLNQGPR